MTTEEIKMIVDAVGAVSGDAKDVLVTYFMVDRIPGFIIHILWVFISFFLVEKGLKFAYTTSECMNYIKRKRDQYEIGRAGYLTEAEIRQTIEKIEKDLKVRS